MRMSSPRISSSQMSELMQMMEIASKPAVAKKMLEEINEKLKELEALEASLPRKKGELDGLEASLKVKEKNSEEYFQTLVGLKKQLGEKEEALSGKASFLSQREKDLDFKEAELKKHFDSNHEALENKLKSTSARMQEALDLKKQADQLMAEYKEKSEKLKALVG